MKTLYLNSGQMDVAADLLKQGEVVGFPTETVYGLGVVYDNPLAFSRLVKAKNRPENKPFTLMCGYLEDIKKVAVVDDRTERIIEKFMPGAITLLLEKKDGLPDWVTLGSPFVGVRISSHPLVLSVIRKVQKPLLVPSANLAGEPPLSLYKEIQDVFDGKIAAIFKEDSSGQKPSTIVKINGNQLECVREGAIPFQEIKKVWEASL